MSLSAKYSTVIPPCLYACGESDRTESLPCFLLLGVHKIVLCSRSHLPILAVSRAMWKEFDKLGPENTFYTQAQLLFTLNAHRASFLLLLLKPWELHISLEKCWKGGDYREFRKKQRKWKMRGTPIPGAFYLLCFKKNFFSPGLYWDSSVLFEIIKCVYPVRDPKNFIVHTTSLWVLNLIWSVFIIPLKNKQKHSPTGRTDDLKHELDSFCSFTLSFPWIHNPTLSKQNN